MPFIDAFENSVRAQVAARERARCEHRLGEVGVDERAPDGRDPFGLDEPEVGVVELALAEATSRSFASEMTIPDMRQFTNSTRCIDASVRIAPDNSQSTARTSTSRRCSSRAPVSRRPCSKQPEISTWSAT